MGTNLRKRDPSTGSTHETEQVYVTAAIGLCLDTPNLALPIVWDHDDEKLPTQAHDDICPGEVLKSIKINICCCASVTVIDQYSTFCNHFEQYEHFYTFCYDWRRDLNETTDCLREFLAEIKSKHGIAAQVVSHSMGCLIALAAYHTNPSLFHSTLFCGGNFAGGAGFYPTNTDGMIVGCNKAYLGPNVVHTFPSMFAAASPMGVGIDPILKDADGRQLWQFVDSNDTSRVIDINMWDIEDWKKYKIGPWVLQKKGKPVAVSDEMEEHIKICLRLGHAFQMKMRNLSMELDAYVPIQQTENEHYPPVAVLVGDKYLNPVNFLWDTDHNRIVKWTPKLIKKHQPMQFGRTDGTVSFISASQPPGCPEVLEYIARNNGHGIGAHRDLMNDVGMIDDILEDLRSVE